MKTPEEYLDEARHEFLEDSTALRDFYVRNNLEGCKPLVLRALRAQAADAEKQIANLQAFRDYVKNRLPGAINSIDELSKAVERWEEYTKP